MVVGPAPQAASTSRHAHGSVEGTAGKIASVLVLRVREEAAARVHQGETGKESHTGITFSVSYEFGILHCKVMEQDLVTSCSFLSRLKIVAPHFGDFSESNKKCFSL